MNNILIISQFPEFLPERKTVWSVCMDLMVIEDVTIEPGKIKVVSAGIKTVIPMWRHAKVYARSGLPTKQWLTLANAVAIFDADYRGEYWLQLWNISDQTVEVKKWTRVCQIEFCPTYMPELWIIWTIDVPELQIICDSYQYEHCETLYPTVRGSGALHSTGV